MCRWVHPDVLARAAPISLTAAIGLAFAGDLSGVIFHAGGGRSMLAVEAATRGWIHHSLAWGVASTAVLALLAFGPAGVRLRHLGLDVRELRRWIATVVVGWCAIQVVLVAAAWIGFLPRLRSAAPLPESVGLFAAVLLRVAPVEEILSRGILLPVLVRRLGVVAGLAVGALEFAAGHIPSLLTLSPVEVAWALIVYWIGALLAGALYLRSASLLTLAAFHTLRDVPTPFEISDDTYTVLFIAIYAGSALYIWLGRWPLEGERSPAPR